MHSNPGGPEQPKHADSAPVGHLCGMEYSKLPLVVLFATEEETKLHIWQYPNSTTKTTIYLKRGEMLVMRGDMAHAGASYDANHWRVHMYIDSRWVIGDLPTLPAATPLEKPPPKKTVYTYVCQCSSVRCECWAPGGVFWPSDS